MVVYPRPDESSAPAPLPGGAGRNPQVPIAAPGPVQNAQTTSGIQLFESVRYVLPLLTDGV